MLKAILRQKIQPYHQNGTMIRMQHGVQILPLLLLMFMTITGDGTIGIIGMLVGDGAQVGMQAGVGTIGMAQVGAGDGTVGTAQVGDGDGTIGMEQAGVGMAGMEMVGVMVGTEITMLTQEEEEPVAIMVTDIQREDIMEEHPTQQAEEPLHGITLEQEQEVLQPEALKFLQETQVAPENITAMQEHVVLLAQPHLHQV